MRWQPFEELDLFGTPVGAPVKVLRGALSEYDEEQTGFSQYLGVEQFDAVMGGKVWPVPRLEAWYGLRAYSFGGRTIRPREPMPSDLFDVKSLVEDFTGERFDSCFVNLYRDQNDHIPWHADDDDWIGPVIASVSLGSTRRFWIRKKADHKAVVRGEMRHGDIVLMTEGCQAEWEHSVPKESSFRGVRLNLTFRQTMHT